MGARLSPEQQLFILGLADVWSPPARCHSCPASAGPGAAEGPICILPCSPPHQGHLATEGLPTVSPLQPDRPLQGGQPAQDWGFRGFGTPRTPGRPLSELLVTSACPDRLWTVGVALAPHSSCASLRAQI